MKLEDRINGGSKPKSEIPFHLQKEPVTTNIRDNFHSVKKNKEKLPERERVKNSLPFRKKNKTDKKVYETESAEKIFMRQEKESVVSIDDELENISKENEQASIKRVQREKRISLIYRISAIIACFYAVFLLFGASITKYSYNDKGRYEPLVMTLSDIEEKANYEKILYYYKESISLYEEVIDIDYSLSQGANSSAISTKYTQKLADADRLIRQIKGIDIDVKYSATQTMLVNWISNDLAVYMQNISIAISTNNSTKMNNALQDRSRTSVDFDTITSNMVGLGNSIKGVDTSSFKDWSFNNYSKSLQK